MRYREIWIVAIITAIPSQIFAIVWDYFKEGNLYNFSDPVHLGLQIFAILSFSITLIFIYFDWTKTKRRKPIDEPDPKKYRIHIEDLYNHIHVKQEGVHAKSLYEIVRDSDLREQIFQHLVTYFTYKDQKTPEIFEQFLAASSAEKRKLHPPLSDYIIKQFHDSFYHVLQIMKAGQPVGLCDICKRNYAETDKKDLLKILEYYHRKRNDFKQVFEFG